MKVDFLVVGVQKAGTTALHAFLETHPSLALPIGEKEVHFFDQEEFDWDNPDYSDYHQCFEPKAGQLVGEITPIYSYWQPCAERIYKYNPDMKLIMCLRDPVRRAFSNWEMEMSRGDERYKFPKAIRRGRRRVAKKGQYGCHRTFGYVERGFYAEQINRLLAYFPREQLHIFDFEHFKRQRDAVLDGVCSFLGIAPFDVYPENTEHQPTVKRADLGSILPDDAAYLADLYRSDTRKTAELTGLDLSHWRSS